VRLLEPDAFTCAQNTDCASDERCSGDRRCVPKESCDSLNDCAFDQSCKNGKCVAAECYTGNAAACGAFRCSEYERVCVTSCFSDAGDCQPGNVCKEQVCVPGLNLANGKPCTVDGDCASRVCCGPAGAKLCNGSCGTSGESCTTGLDCSSGNCCMTPWGAHACGSLACVLLGVGAACLRAEECLSGTCADGFCRGTAGYNEVCKTDSDCEAGRACCKNPYASESLRCGDLTNGCDGANGDSCSLGGNSSCLSDQCLAYTLCTQPCKIDADCGISPWGTKNQCKKNGVGNLICFPGCTTENECHDHVDDFFSCTSGVCSGGLYTVRELQLW
jgi:hypothetical protein